MRINKHFPWKEREQTLPAQDQFPNDNASQFQSPGQTNPQENAMSPKLKLSWKGVKGPRSLNFNRKLMQMTERPILGNLQEDIFCISLANKLF